MNVELVNTEKFLRFSVLCAVRTVCQFFIVIFLMKFVYFITCESGIKMLNCASEIRNMDFFRIKKAVCLNDMEVIQYEMPSLRC